MVASVEETESSASSTSSGRHSAALPIVGPPRGLLARVSREGKSFSGFIAWRIMRRGKLHYKTNSLIISRIIRLELVVDYQPDYQLNYQPHYQPGSTEVPAW